MRRIERTGQFKQDYRRVRRLRYRATLDTDLVGVLESLGNDQSLDPRHRDHQLAGEWRDRRDCHISPDLILIYRKTGKEEFAVGAPGFPQRIGTVRAG